MSDTRKLAAVKGPASYFPSLEKTYGRPIAHWLAVVTEMADAKHMEIVTALKADHGTGHGHANAIVAYALAQRKAVGKVN